MKISTKGRYALRLMIDIAHQDKDAIVPLKDVSNRQEISIKYLEQIVPSLTKAELIRSVRGPRGGYTLTREVEDYTIKDIIEAAEGPISCVSCLVEDAKRCPRYENCPTIHFYEGLNQHIAQYLDQYTLLDLMDNGCNFLK